MDFTRLYSLKALDGLGNTHELLSINLKEALSKLADDCNSDFKYILISSRNVPRRMAEFLINEYSPSPALHSATPVEGWWRF